MKPALVIACGALAREILDIIELNRLQAVELTCLPAKLHNYPDRIPAALREKICEARDSGAYSSIFAGYADCGTGGLIDQVLEEEGVPRLEGPHCYQFFAGKERFEAINDHDPTAFYLTDFLARHFDTLIIKGLGIDRHPDLLPLYFGNYTRLIYLSQIKDEAAEASAKAAAERLGLAFEHVHTGYGELADFILAAQAAGNQT